MQQIGNNAFTRNFNYANGKNTLNGVSIGVNNYTYLYDSVGNLLTENVNRHYEWDAANQLIYFKNQVGNAEPTVMAQYLYDAGGNRVKKIVRKQGGSYEIRTYIDGVFEHFTDETEEQNTVHVMDNQSRVVAIRIGDAMGDTTPSIQYILENNIGSSTVTLDDNGTEINQQEYYPFGETSFGSYTKKRYQYTGKERDNESGLYYYGARYYSPWICRFISVDPLAAKYPFYNPYNYAGNKPVNFIDIDGLQEGQAQQQEGGNSDNLNPQGSGIEASKAPHSFTTPGGNQVTFQESYKNATTDLGGTATLESGNKVELAPGVLTSFEVNGTTYNGFFEKSGDGSYSFAGYRDADKNVYNNFVESGDKTVISKESKETKVNIEDKSKSSPKQEKENEATGLSNDITEVNTLIGAFGIGNSAKTEIIDYVIRTNYKSARSWGEFNKLRQTQQIWRSTNTLGKTGVGYLKFAKGLGVVGAGATVTYSVANAGTYYYNGGTDWKVGAKATLDVVMTGVGFLGPIGFAISASYFLIDAATDSFGGFGKIKH